jgi:hypothetical protein
LDGRRVAIEFMEAFVLDGTGIKAIDVLREATDLDCHGKRLAG